MADQNNNYNPYSDPVDQGGQNYYSDQGLRLRNNYMDGNQNDVQNNYQNGYQDNYQSGYQNSYQDSYQNGYQNNYQSGLGAGVGAVAADLLNTVLAKSFMYMFIALLVTGITSLFVAASPAFVSMFWGSSRVPFYICAIVEIALVYACTATIKQNSVALSGFLFFAYAVVNGITFSVIFLAFEMSSISMVFFMTAVVFGIMAFIGAFTKKDLTGWGTVLLAGLLGIIIASVMNFFFRSSVLDLFITIIGIVIFLALTIYDVNKIKKLASENTGLSANVLGLYGAMQLYLDFINIFLKLLRLFGKRKR